MEQRWLCDAAVGSPEAGSDHPATPGGSCDGSPPGTTERTGGRRQAPLEEEGEGKEVEKEEEMEEEEQKDKEEEEGGGGR